MDWRPVQGVSCLPPNDSWDSLQRPRRISGLDDETVAFRKLWSAEPHSCTHSHIYIYGWLSAEHPDNFKTSPRSQNLCSSMSPKWTVLTVLIFHLCTAKLQLGPKPGPAPAPDPDSELITYDPNSAPCKPSSNGYKNEIFNKQHLATLRKYGTDLKLWTTYIKHIKDPAICYKTYRIKSFLDESVAKQVEKVCSPSGGKLFERGKNLCISNKAFNFIEVRWNENCEAWKVSNVTQHIILACDEIDQKCLPVHFEKNPQNLLPNKNSPNCGS
ncbi:uncharacterized protein LOC118814416 [Colossoma macropomum]|uniref:uncharacterized protein LOC118814416 n=1 Tax=Colossoma macropomum TaxID=42526 RepID=UPI0018652468|nr:uncharacterized protein LOC118814416 [Colossoma macropomum]